MNKKVLILYVARNSSGHKTTAENLAFFLRQAGMSVELFDVQTVQEGSLTRFGIKSYQFLLSKFPKVWSWLYDTKWFITATLPFRTWVAGFNYKNVLSIIKSFDPDAVLSDHTTASAILDYLKSRQLYIGLFGIVFCDYHLHRYWLYDHADFYLVNIEEQKREMVELGVLPDKIFVCGMALKPKAEINISQIKNKLDIGEQEKVILIASGSQGFGITEAFVKQFLVIANAKVIVLCGKNKQLFESLSQKFAGQNKVVILGFYSPVDELYAVADVFVSKAGGLSVAEALRWHLPIAVFHLLPGQEAHNYGYLLKQGLVMPKTANLAARVLAELETSSFKQALIERGAMDWLFNGGQRAVESIEHQLGN